jgi:hypothetical protein
MTRSETFGFMQVQAPNYLDDSKKTSAEACPVISLQEASRQTILTSSGQ